MKVWGGIDPGNTGCLVLIYGDQIDFHDAPTATVKSGKRNRTVLVPQEMANILKSAKYLSYLDEAPIGDIGGQELYPINLHVYVEKVNAMPGQSPNSMFNFGMGYGLWLGVLAALQIPYTLVTPQRWKREQMAGMGKEKSAACVRAAQLFPAISDQLSRPKRGGGIIYLDGRGDALLIADLCRKEQP